MSLIQNQFARIYDRLNEQPHLQAIIKQEVLEQLLKEEAKDAKFHLLDTLNYAFKNVRKHQVQIYGRILERSFLTFMKHSMFYQVIGHNKFGPINYGFKGIIEQFYGSDFNDYFQYEYGPTSDSENDSEYLSCNDSEYLSCNDSE